MFVETLTSRVRLSVLSATQRHLKTGLSPKVLSAAQRRFKMGVSPHHVLARSRAVQKVATFRGSSIHTRDLAANRFMSHAVSPLLHSSEPSHIAMSDVKERGRYPPPSCETGCGSTGTGAGSAGPGPSGAGGGTGPGPGTKGAGVGPGFPKKDGEPRNFPKKGATSASRRRSSGGLELPTMP